VERRLKERLIGAAVLTIIAVIFIPMVLDDTEHPPSAIVTTNIPPRPEGEFTSRIVPIPTRVEPAGEPAPSPAPGPVPEAASTGDSAAAPEPETLPSTVAAVPSAPEQAPPAESTPPAAKETPPAASAPAKPAGNAATAAKPAAKPAADAPDKVGLTAWVVQLGSFSSEENARALNERLRKRGYSAFVEPLKQDGEQVYRVRVGPELLRSEAQALRDRIRAETQLEGIVVSYP
jgi:DedD protein